ncbi:DUF4190 domain-containing protein [Gordonia sp. (in: high G+C Gram-positive bacteria)]|uniref:DUF4190 domain-containing protein n=2 Tax=unclassified Gordonia (in: high G+C Gram-positive bacteria) TaxID=2657482 RepID=UPI00257D721E|nr:DUF4190 domain-containing protein [Gordonia sp. (in: high G+C Gram-positive bacteria)]
MRETDHPTESIPPALTDRIARWPLENIDTQLPETGESTIETLRDRPGATDESAAVPGSMWPPSAMNASWPLSASSSANDAPLPPVADVWYPAPVMATDSRHLNTNGMNAPAQPSSRMATTALITSMISLPLALVGVGAILGFIATTLGVIALVQIASGRRPAPEPNRYRGTGRAVAGTVAGIASMIIGAPILLVILMVLAIV